MTGYSCDAQERTRTEDYSQIHVLWHTDACTCVNLHECDSVRLFLPRWIDASGNFGSSPETNSEGMSRAYMKTLFPVDPGRSGS